MMTSVALELNAWAEDIFDWSQHNFGGVFECPPVIATLGLAEEAGEVCRAVLKQHQGIRGTYEEWQEEIAKELGDVMIKCADVATRCGIPLGDALQARWETISQRDWKADKIGHGI